MGGTTPDAALIERCAASLTIPVFVMIRPRGGDFVYDAGEVAAMADAIRTAAAAGAHGVVFGALRPDATIDVDVMRRLIDVARPLPVTCHKAIDATRDPLEALDALLALGVDRVLTSGGADTAAAGAATIARMVARAGDALVVMAGGGVRAHNVAALVRQTGVREVHARLLPAGVAAPADAGTRAAWAGRSARSSMAFVRPRLSGGVRASLPWHTSRQMLRLLLPTLLTLAAGFAPTAPAKHKVFFNRFRLQEVSIMIADADGRNERPLVPHGTLEYSPSYSADGKWVVFTKETAGLSDIYRIHPDGSDLERLTDDPAFDDQGVLSPDGRTLAFISTRGSGTANLWLLDLAARKYTNLTTNQGATSGRRGRPTAPGLPSAPIVKARQA